MIEFQRLGGVVFIIYVKDDSVVMYGGDIRIINAGKSIVAFGKFFLARVPAITFPPNTIEIP